MIMLEFCFVFLLVATQQDLVSTQRWWDNSAPKTNTNVSKVTKATNPVNTTSAPSAQPAVHKFDLGSGYEIFFDGRFISFKPITSGQAKGKPGAATKSGQSALGMLLSGQGGSLELTLNNQTKTLGGMPAQGSHKVSGWAGGPTTEPPLGPNDRMNTTDVPEEIEARPDKTRAQRRALLRRMNPGFTNAQIEAQLIRDDKARAKMAATQSEPVVLLPEPVTPPTPPPPRAKLNAKKPSPGVKPRKVFRARRKKKQNKVVPKRRPRPRPRTTTTPEPTYPPTYPTTTQYYPTTYPTPANYQYNGGPQNNQYQQQQFQPAQQYQPPPRRQQQFQPAQQQYQPTGPPPQQQQQQRPVRPRRRQQRRNRRPQGRPIVGSEVDHILSLFGRRQERLRTTTDREEIPARDRIARWFLNNIDTEVLDTFLPLFAMG
ncbi:hypothetical protein ACF0H5_024262 [Mactra antiquata]